MTAYSRTDWATPREAAAILGVRDAFEALNVADEAGVATREDARTIILRRSDLERVAAERRRPFEEARRFLDNARPVHIFTRAPEAGDEVTDADKEWARAFLRRYGGHA